MENLSITLSNGDILTFLGVVTRALDKKISGRVFKNTKLVRGKDGTFEVANFDMDETQAVADFKLLTMVTEVKKADGTISPISQEYIDAMLKQDFDAAFAAVENVISPKKAEDEKKG